VDKTLDLHRLNVSQNYFKSVANKETLNLKPESHNV